jgi:hypothetical protein
MVKESVSKMGTTEVGFTTLMMDGRGDLQFNMDSKDDEDLVFLTLTVLPVSEIRGKRRQKRS